MCATLSRKWQRSFHDMNNNDNIINRNVLNDEVDEFGLTTDDWDVVERLRDFYERFLSDYFPEVDVEAVIGEMDFELHPSIIIHRYQGYKKMASFHFGLDRNDKTISGYILAFKK